MNRLSLCPVRSVRASVSGPGRASSPQPPCVAEFSRISFRVHCSTMRIPAEFCPRLYRPSLYPRTQKSKALRAMRFRLHCQRASPQPDRNEQSQSTTELSVTRISMIPFCPLRAVTRRSVTSVESSTHRPAPYCVIQPSSAFRWTQSQSLPSSRDGVEASFWRKFADTSTSSITRPVQLRAWIPTLYPRTLMFLSVMSQPSTRTPVPANVSGGCASSAPTSSAPPKSTTRWLPWIRTAPSASASGTWNRPPGTDTVSRMTRLSRTGGLWAHAAAVTASPQITVPKERITTPYRLRAPRV